MKKFNIFIFSIFSIIFCVEKRRNLDNNQSEIRLVIQGSEGASTILMSGDDPSEVLVNGLTDSNCSKTCHLPEGENNVTLIFSGQLSTCDTMFYGLTNILEIDLSDFDFSKVTSINNMFRDCSYLKKINFGNINTSSLENMEFAFAYCSSLTSIDLSNFDTSNVNKANNMFFGCEGLKYLDLSNFNTSKFTTIQNMFNGCVALIYLNLSSFKLSSSVDVSTAFYGKSGKTQYCVRDTNTANILSDIISNCSDTCFQENSKLDLINNTCTLSCLDNGFDYEYNNICYKECPKGTLVNGNKCEDNKCKDESQNIIECLDKTPQEYYLDSSDELYKKCFQNCKFCYGPGNETINNCIECNTNYTFLNGSLDNTTCYKICEYYDYFDENNIYHCTENCQSEYSKLILDKKRCIKECKNDGIYLYEYNNICYDNCPSGSYSLNQNDKYLCLNTAPDGYYLDLTEKIFKQCYSTCSKCDKGGDAQNNNCIECKLNYIFLYNPLNISNCYSKCDFYYYFDEFNNYRCTENDNCPEQYSKLIVDENKCIKECKNDDIYKYEYNNKCYSTCPEKTSYSEINETCIDDMSNIYKCSNNNDSLVSLCNMKDIKNNTEIYNIIRDFILQEYSSDSEKSQVIEGQDDIIYQITTGKNELELLNGNISEDYNLSIIDLGECETILREAYNIEEGDFIIYLKQQKISDKASEQDFQLEVFEPYNKTKLNLSLCSGININLYSKIELNPDTEALSEQIEKFGYNMFDINDRFYQDICTPYKSLNNTDVLISDRIGYIYNNNDTQCQDNCQFSEYFFDSEYIKCICNVDGINQDNEKKQENFKPKKIYESFVDVLKYSNYKILKCSKLVFNKKIFTKNVGNIIILVFFAFYLTTLIIYIIKGLSPLKNKLLEIMDEETKEIDFKEDEKNEIKIYDNKNNSHLSSSKKNICESQVSLSKPKKNKNKNKIKKKKGIPLKTVTNPNKKKILKRPKLKDKDKIDDKKVRINTEVDAKKNTKFKDTNSVSVVKIKRNIKDKDKPNQSILPLTEKKEENEQKELDDFELNELEYEEAIKYDKRNFIRIYFSFLKREHRIIFTFFICNDYNLNYIKYIRFIFLFATDMTMNIIFFSDKSMHKLFLDYGKYNFIQQVPQIIYSTIVSQIIELFLCFLSLTDTHIYQIKKLKPFDQNSAEVAKIFRCIKIKLCCFFIFIVLFLGFYWYMVTSFCSVYENTQKVFIKDSLFSFLLSIIYSFILYLIPSAFRLCAIRNEKGELKCLYKFSEIIPFF